MTPVRQGEGGWKSLKLTILCFLVVTDMGRCIVYYFASKDDCLDGLHPTMSLGDHERGTWYSWRYSRNRYYQVDC